jgi:hypothetical protein
MEKMDFEQVYGVFDALNIAFHPNGIDEDGLNDHFQALWVLFLSTSGWTEDEFWEEMEKGEEHVCEKCQAEAEEKAKTSVN